MGSDRTHERPRRPRRSTVALLLAAALAVATSVAHAEPTAADKATARALMDRGDALFASKDVAGALAAYRGAHELMGVPTTGLEVAKAHEALGHLVEALDVALEVARMPARAGEPAAFTDARGAATALAKRVEPRVPTLVIEVRGAADGAAPTVEVDGAAVPAAAAGLPRKVNPGKHVVKASAAGRTPATREVAAIEGQSATVSLALEPLATPAAAPGSAPSQTPVAPPPAPAQAPRDGSVSPLVILGFGAGVIGIGVGAVTGGLSLSRAAAAKSACQSTRCPVSAGPDIDAAKGLAWGSDIGFAIGALGIATGIVGLVIGDGAPKEKPKRAVVLRPELGPGYAGVGGAF